MFSLLAALTLVQPPADGEAIIRAIHAAHSKSWFKTMTFVQKTTLPNQPIQWWYETMETNPARLRIDIAKPDGSIGNSQIYRNDSVYTIANGAVTRVRPFVHSMIVLIVDLHTLNPDSSIARLKKLGYDLSRSYENSWNGKKVTVVGASAKSDTTSRQFWVDMDQQTVVRMIDPVGTAGGIQDVHIGKHARDGASLIEREIMVHRLGAMSQGEEYIWVKTGVTLEPGLFDPGKFIPAAWIDAYKKEKGLPGGQ